MRFLVVMALCSLALAADLEERLRQADVRIARRFSTLGLKAEKLGQRATARRLFERVLALDPKNRIARGKLGYKKSGGAWARSSRSAIEIDAWEDSDPERAAKLRDERGKLEQMRAREVLKLTGKWGTPESARPALLALLDSLPRMEAVHVALGHEKIGAVYVRHELTDFMRAMPQRMTKWKACREPGVA
ncbi:MAG: hypothetical protein ACYTEG_17830, partial [Planctomycetota bacterium]